MVSLSDSLLSGSVADWLSLTDDSDRGLPATEWYFLEVHGWWCSQGADFGVLTHMSEKMLFGWCQLDKFDWAALADGSSVTVLTNDTLAVLALVDSSSHGNPAADHIKE